MRTSPTWFFGSSTTLRNVALRLRPALVLAVAIVALVRGRALAADEEPRVIVVSSDPDSTRCRRLAAELRSLGLSVVSMLPVTDAAPDVALPALARREHAMAAVQVLTLALKEQVWIADRVTNKTVLRELPRNSLRPDQTDDSIAVGVAELLRASLMEVNSESHARGDYAPTPRVRELAYPSVVRAGASSSVWAAASAGVQPGLRGSGRAWIAQAGGAWRTNAGFGLEAFLVATVIPSSVAGLAGEAQLSSQWVGVGPLLEWPARSGRLHGELGIAIVGSRVVARGERVLLRFIPAQETGYSPGLYLHGGPAFGVDRFQLRLDIGVLFLSSPAIIHLADQRAAVWGAPAAHLTLGIAARVWPD
jgi:hypothetical protein